MKPSNFPGRQNARRLSALKRITDGANPKNKDPLRHKIADTLALRLTSDATARAVSTKKDRRAFAKVSR